VNIYANLCDFVISFEVKEISVSAELSTEIIQRNLNVLCIAHGRGKDVFSAVTA
jgi:hypothetical protein